MTTSKMVHHFVYWGNILFLTFIKLLHFCEIPQDDQAFQKAMQLVEREFAETVNYFSHCWWPAREIVSRAMQNRASVDSSGAIIVLEQSCPWKAHLFDLESEERSETVVYPQSPRLTTYRLEPKFPQKILFVVYPSQEGNWAVQSVPKDSFGNRYVILRDCRHSRGDRHRSSLPCFWIPLISNRNLLYFWPVSGWSQSAGSPKWMRSTLIDSTD